MGTTTQKQRRLNPAIDTATDDEIREHYRAAHAFHKGKGKPSMAATARECDVSEYSARKAIKAKIVRDHSPSGRWAIWCNSPDLGGDCRLVGKIVDTTTLDEQSAARFTFEKVARKWLADHRHEFMVGPDKVLGSLNPVVINLDAVGV